MSAAETHSLQTFTGTYAAKRFTDQSNALELLTQALETLQTFIKAAADENSARFVDELALADAKQGALTIQTVERRLANFIETSVARSTAELLRGTKEIIPEALLGLSVAASAYARLGTDNAYKLSELVNTARGVLADYEVPGQRAAYSQICFRNVELIGALSKDLTTSMWLLPGEPIPS